VKEEEKKETFSLLIGRRRKRKNIEGEGEEGNTNNEE